MEHRYTVTEDGTSAGCWWGSLATCPEVAWMYDQPRRVLVVNTRSGWRTEHRIVATAPMPADPRGSFLPGLALQIARRAAQQWRG